MDNETLNLPPANPTFQRKFLLLLAAGAIGLIYILLWQGIPLFEKIAENLPLLLPLAVTILSISVRASQLKSPDALLTTSNDIAIGIISFDIWAISSLRGNPNGRVLVNAHTMIRGDFVLPFLLAGLLVAIGCVVLTIESYIIQ